LSTNVAGRGRTAQQEHPANPRKPGRSGTAYHSLARRPQIYDIFEGTAEIQQLVIARAISGMYIK
jgi:hypothetical protein